MSSRPPESEGTFTRSSGRSSDHERQAAEAAQAAREHGREAFEQARHGAADRTDELADTIERTASEGADPDDLISDYGHSMASLMRRLSGGLREGDIQQFAGELTHFARRNPAVFLAGSVALGFGLSRVLKASGGRGGHEHDDDYALDAEEFFSEELGADPDEDREDRFGAEGSRHGTSSADQDQPWPEDRATRSAEYPEGATGQPAGLGGDDRSGMNQTGIGAASEGRQEQERHETGGKP